jgi:uncharacterized protein (DUF736 family)
MAYIPREASGSLFRNELKKPGEKTPDYRGTVMWRGDILEIAGWIKSKDDGSKFLSIKIQEPRDKQQPAARPSLKDEMADDIPF